MRSPFSCAHNAPTRSPWRQLDITEQPHPHGGNLPLCFSTPPAKPAAPPLFSLHFFSLGMKCQERQMSCCCFFVLVGVVRSCECLGEERLNLTAHVCTGEDVRAGDTFVTCGVEQPGVTTRASHDAYNNKKKRSQEAG